MNDMFGTVGDILRENPQLPGEGVPDEKPAPVMPPRLEGQPEFPAPGIYFGMDEEVYHAINAFSASLAKKLSISTMDAWAASNLNPLRETGEKEFLTLGKAYHCRICEGATEYGRRYAVALDKADFPGVLVTIDDIKLALAKADVEIPTRIGTGEMVPSPVKADPDRMKELTRAATKEDLIALLADHDPDAQIWDALVADHASENEGREMISARSHFRIEIAAAMIERDPQLSKAFSGGHAEVSIFWFDEKTGCPCKARLDYLKLLAIVDLKSFSNTLGRPVARAIDYTIANQRHYIPVMFYREAVAAAKQMIATDAAHIAINPFMPQGDIVTWCAKLAKADEPQALYVYQQTGQAPVTRGRIMTIGTVATITDAYLQSWKKRYVECVNVYGVEPWIDSAPIDYTTDENLPPSTTDLGE